MGTSSDLRQALASVSSALADTNADATDQTARWRLLDDLVDRHLRAVSTTAQEDSSPRVDFVRDGAAGVVAHYDRVVSQADSES